MKKKSWLLGLGGLNILLLGLVSLLNDFSSEMILPILPMLITGLGGTGLVVGIVGGLMSGLPELLKVFVGFWSDKTKKRKLFIFLGYLDSQIFKFLLVFSKSWQSVMLFASLDKLGKGIREAPRDALISESLPGEKGRAFGIQRTFDTMGAILGSVAVLLLVLFLGMGLKSIILISAIVGFFSLIPLYFLKDVDNSVGRRRKKVKNIYASLRDIPKSLKIFLFASALFALGNFSYMFFVLKSTSFFTSGIWTGNMKFAMPILLYVVFNIFYAGMAVPFGKLSDKIGRKKVLSGGYLLFAFVCLGFALANSIFWMFILFICYGLTYAMIVGNQRAFVSDLSDERLRATSIGAFQTITGVCAIASGIIAGLLFDLNNNFTFYSGFILSLISLLVFLIFVKEKK